MAVAVKNASEAAPQSPLERLPVSSLVGAAYVLGSIGVVYYLLPFLWYQLFPAGLLNDLADSTFRLLGMLGAAAGLVGLARRLLGTQAPEGLKGGVAVVLIGLAGVGLVTWCVGALLEKFFPEGETWRLVGLVLTLAVGVGLLALGFRKFMQPGTEEYLVAFEHQGWFTWERYKENQGRRVRRGTVVGILLLAGTGIWRMWEHKALEYGVAQGMNHWYLPLPFTGGEQLILLRDVRLIVPVLLAAATLWFAYRLVNYPTFADFLVATEAELNKVSWTTKKRLYQDTLVVLTTVILMTFFLFVVDMAWFHILSSRVIGVLKSSPSGQTATQYKEIPW